MDVKGFYEVHIYVLHFHFIHKQICTKVLHALPVTVYNKLHIQYMMLLYQNTQWHCIKKISFCTLECIGMESILSKVLPQLNHMVLLYLQKRFFIFKTFLNPYNINNYVVRMFINGNGAALHSKNKNEAALNIYIDTLLHTHCGSGCHSFTRPWLFLNTTEWFIAALSEIFSNLIVKSFKVHYLQKFNILNLDQQSYWKV